MRRFAATSLAFALALTAAPVHAAPGTEDVAAGEAAWREQRWDDASAAFARAYEATGDPTYLYTRAQAERSAGRCEVALSLYEEFVGTGPAPKAELAARRYMEECRVELEAAASAQKDPAPDPVGDPVGPVGPTEPDAGSETGTGSQPPGAADDVEEPRAWYRDPWGDALVGVGVAASVTGGVLVGVAYRDADRADGSSDDRAFGDALDRAQTFETVGAITLGIGAALVVAGVVRWALVGTKARRTRVGATRSGLVVSGTLPRITARSGAATRRATAPARSRSRPRRR